MKKGWFFSHRLSFSAHLLGKWSEEKGRTEQLTKIEPRLTIEREREIKVGGKRASPTGMRGIDGQLYVAVDPMAIMNERNKRREECDIWRSEECDICSLLWQPRYLLTLYFSSTACEKYRKNTWYTRAYNVPLYAVLFVPRNNDLVGRSTASLFFISFFDGSWFRLSTRAKGRDAAEETGDPRLDAFVFHWLRYLNLKG